MARRSDDLGRLPVDGSEVRAQDFMSPHNFIKALLKRRDIQTSFELNGARQIVNGAAGHELIQKP
jgi:hypothetical protein